MICIPRMALVWVISTKIQWLTASLVYSVGVDHYSKIIFQKAYKGVEDQGLSFLFINFKPIRLLYPSKQLIAFNNDHGPPFPCTARSPIAGLTSPCRCGRSSRRKQSIQVNHSNPPRHRKVPSQRHAARTSAMAYSRGKEIPYRESSSVETVSAKTNGWVQRSSIHPATGPTSSRDGNRLGTCVLANGSTSGPNGT